MERKKATVGPLYDAYRAARGGSVGRSEGVVTSRGMVTVSRRVPKCRRLSLEFFDDFPYNRHLRPSDVTSMIVSLRPDPLTGSIALGRSGGIAAGRFESTRRMPALLLVFRRT
jgi:hypothetical protein